MRRAALGGGLLALVIGFVAFVYPFLTRERDFLATTPQPPALTAVSLVELKAGEQACLDKAVVDEHAGRALITVGTYGRPPAPLRLSITGRGLREVRRVPPTYAENLTFTVPVDPPDQAVVTTICIRNDGRRKIALYGDAERTSRSTTRVDGKPVPANFAIAFAERKHHTLLERLPLAVERMQAFRPDVTWLAWLVAVLFVIGMPLAAVWALAAGAHADEERDIGAPQIGGPNEGVQPGLAADRRAP
jgi:hypothetical protein